MLLIYPDFVHDGARKGDAGFLVNWRTFWLEQNRNKGKLSAKKAKEYRMSHDQPPTTEPARLSCFGPAPLFDGEDSAGYDELLARVSGAIKPADIIEEIWIRDI